MSKLMCMMDEAGKEQRRRVLEPGHYRTVLYLVCGIIPFRGWTTEAVTKWYDNK